MDKRQTVSEHTAWVRSEAARRGVDLTPHRSTIRDRLKATAPVWLPIILGIILLVLLLKS